MQPFLQFEIHDNGDKPWIVEILEDQSIQVIRTKYQRETKKFIPIGIEKTYPKGVQFFVGRNGKPSTLFPEENPYVKNDGNTLLVKTGTYTYELISRNISEFKTLSEIVTYHSPIENSDMPYPFAFDDQGNCYLFCQNVILLNFGNTATARNIYDPYRYYFKNYVIVSEEKGTTYPKYPHIIGFICEYEDCGRTYKHESDFDYEPVDKNRFDREWIVLEDRTIMILNKEYKQEIFDSFAKDKQFASFPEKKLHISENGARYQ